MTQLTIFDTGEQLRDAGIQQAIDHANEVTEKWSEIAYKFLLEYVKTTRQFMTEDLREASSGKVPEPPSLRAWGGIVTRARKAGIIIPAGYKSVKNVRAHCTPAQVWVRL